MHAPTREISIPSCLKTSLKFKESYFPSVFAYAHIRHVRTNPLFSELFRQDSYSEEAGQFFPIAQFADYQENIILF